MTYRTKMLDGRISLPSRLRTLAGVSDGDSVDVTFVQGGFVVTAAERPTTSKPASRTQQRRAFMVRLRAEAPASLKAMWADAKRSGNDKMTMREIDAIIAEVRAEQAGKQGIKQPAK
jgi:hypothetical protein